MKSFSALRTDLELADVTLACEDGETVEAHRLVLASSSPYFNTILRRSKHPQPLVYMRGVGAELLHSILDFMYQGEANVSQQHLEQFLKLAQDLQLKGLIQENFKSEEIEPPKEQTKREKDTKVSSVVSPLDSSVESSYDDFEEQSLVKLKFDEVEDRSIVSVESFDGSLTSPSSKEELATKVSSMMERVTGEDGTNMWKCTVCGKTAKHKPGVSRHVEIHIEGLSFPCNICEQVFSSSSALRRHTYKHTSKDL